MRGNPLRLGCALVCVVLLGACMGSQNRPLQLLSGSGPSYPVDARRAGIEGEVVVRYDVSLEGMVVNARIKSADPAGIFDQAALAAVSSWRYNPQLRDGEVEAVRNIVSTVRFRLDDNRAYDEH